MNLLRVLFLLFLAAPAIAADVTLTWDSPTERENGSQLPATEIGGYIVKNGNDLLTVEGNINELTIPDLPPGEYFFSVATVDTDGLKSAFSETVSILIPAAPSPPSNIKVIIKVQIEVIQ